LENLPEAPCIQPQNPNNFDIQPPYQHTPTHPSKTLDAHITRSHYDRAVSRAPVCKTPSQDAITNELIKHLPETAHKIIYKLFLIMAKHSYTPIERCRSATCLLYKPNKNPHNIAKYRPIALVNGILKLWTSILAYIGSSWEEAQGILSDAADGFRQHRKICDDLFTHIMMYEDAKMSKKHIYTTAFSYFKGAFGGMDHRILFKRMRELGFPE